MKIRYKFKLLSLGTMVVLAASLVILGTLVIETIVYRLNYRLLAMELQNVHQELNGIVQSHRKAHVEDIPHYIENGKKTAIERLSEHHFGETGRLHVIDDETGEVIFSSSPHNHLALDSLFPQTVLKSFSSESVLRHRFGDVNYFVVHRQFAPWNWTLALVITEDEMFDERTEYLRVVSVIALMMFLLTYLFLQTFGKRLASRLDQTLETVRRAGTGDLSTRIPIEKSDDEIGRLQQGINAMIEEIGRRSAETHEAQQALLAVRDELEDRVVERTQQLSAEIAERERTEALLHDQRSFQAVLAAIRGIDIDDTDESLWRTFLNTLVMSYGFVMAWYGRYADNQVRPVYSAGHVDKYLDDLVLNIQAPESPDAWCAMSQAILNRRPFGYSDLAHDEGFAAWRDYALELGYGSNLALPLVVDGVTVGGVMVYGGAPKAFDRERVSQLDFLVREMSNRLSDRHRHQQAEQALIRSERMAAVGTLAGGVAHEFNNLNVGILGFAELALQREDLDDDMKDSLTHIRRAALRARNITGSLLTFSGGRRSNPEAASLVDLVQETVPLLSRELERDRIDMVLRLRPTPTTVMDAGQVGQVVLNLLINARHALIDRQQKRITVETGHELNGLEEWVYVRIHDNGCGIPRENLSQIFTPFFSTKGEHAAGGPQAGVKGTGLGLSISHNIVSNHGGHILVDSEVDKGTTFTIRLPVIESSAPSTATESAAPPPVKGATVVVLDDEADTRELLSVLLRKQEYKVFLTADGNEALDYIQNHRVDLVIVDLQMAVMPGRVFLEKMKEIPPRQRPRALVISGRTPEEELQGDDFADVFAAIPKPFEINKILTQVRDAIRDKRGNKRS